MIRNRTVLFVFRLILGGLFIYAGILKVGDPLEFAQDVRNYRLAGQSLSFLTAVFLPWLEIVAGFFLVAGIMKRASALVVSSMLVFFILLVILTIVRGLDVDCGCFGALSRRADLGLIAEDLLMLSMALSILFDRKPARS
jgi:putative oxidoreductase